MMKDLQELLKAMSIWRIAVATLGATILIGFVFSYRVPSSPNIERGSEWIDVASEGDPRVVLRDRHRMGDEFWVMWITDSSPQILAPPTSNIWVHSTVGFIDQKIVEALEADKKRHYRLTVVTTPFGPKAIDKYYLTQFAIAARPDLIIYTVNPTFDFTPWRMLETKSIPGDLATFGSPNSWRWTALLASPSELVEGLAARYFPPVTHRAYFAEIVDSWRNWFDPFKLRSVKPPTRPVPPWTQRDMLTARAIWTGAWFRYDDNKPFTQFRQLLAMRLMDTHSRSLGYQVMEDLVADIRASHIPALIYILPMPIAPIAEDPVAGPNFDQLEKWFKAFAQSQTDGQIKIVEETPSRFLPGLEFYDLSHLTAADPFIQMMSREIKNVADKAD